MLPGPLPFPLATAQEPKGKFQRAKVFWPVNQNDVASPDQFGQQAKRVAKQALDILATTQSFRGQRGVGGVHIRFQTNDVSFGKEPGKHERALGSSPAGLNDPLGL